MKRWMTRGAAIALLGCGMVAAYAHEGDHEPVTTDQLMIAAQKICPVSGEPLEAMGGPIKAESGGRTLFLCCKGCLGRPISKANSAAVTANLIAAQGKCPVMGRALPAQPASVVVGKRTVFVCCKPCIKKLQADPDKYLAVVDQFLAQNTEHHEPAHR